MSSVGGPRICAGKIGADVGVLLRENFRVCAWEILILLIDSESDSSSVSLYALTSISVLTR